MSVVIFGMCDHFWQIEHGRRHLGVTLGHGPREVSGAARNVDQSVIALQRITVEDVISNQCE